MPDYCILRDGEEPAVPVLVPREKRTKCTFIHACVGRKRDTPKLAEEVNTDISKLGPRRGHPEIRRRTSTTRTSQPGPGSQAAERDYTGPVAT